MKIKIIDPIVKNSENSDILNEKFQNNYLKKILDDKTEIDFDYINMALPQWNLFFTHLLMLLKSL